MHHVIITPDYGKTAITKGNATFYYFFVIIYSLKTNKNPNELHTFTAF